MTGRPLIDPNTGEVLDAQGVVRDLTRNVREQANPPPPIQPIHDLEELRTLLWKAHKITVDDNDPILMIHTINRVALDNFDQRLAEMNRALAGRVNDIGYDVVSQIKAVVDEFKSEASAAAVRERVAAIQEAAKLADTSQAAFRRTIKLQIGLTVLNVVAVIFTLGSLTILLR